LPLNTQQKEEIKELLVKSLENKLKKYKRETSYLPFLAALIQDSEKVAAYSFIHSIATTLGMSIYEQISVIITKDNSEKCFRNYGVGGAISSAQKKVIDKIVNDIRNKSRKSDHKKEIDEVLKASSEGAQFQKDGNIADFYMLKNNIEHYFEIKTVKPNTDVFARSKIKLLEWVARRQKEIRVFLALPYNPYYPEPYRRFSEVGMMDPPNDLLVGEEYWNFLGGKRTYSDLLKIFNEVGIQYKDHIKNKFLEIVNYKYKDLKDN